MSTAYSNCKGLFLRDAVVLEFKEEQPALRLDRDPVANDLVRVQITADLGTRPEPFLGIEHSEVETKFSGVRKCL